MAIPKIYVPYTILVHPVRLSLSMSFSHEFEFQTNACKSIDTGPCGPVFLRKFVNKYPDNNCL